MSSKFTTFQSSSTVVEVDKLEVYSQWFNKITALTKIASTTVSLLELT